MQEALDRKFDRSLSWFLSMIIAGSGREIMWKRLEVLASERHQAVSDETVTCPAGGPTDDSEVGITIYKRRLDRMTQGD